MRAAEFVVAPGLESASEQDGGVDEDDLGVTVLGDISRLMDDGVGRVDGHHHPAGRLDGQRRGDPLRQRLGAKTAPRSPGFKPAVPEGPPGEIWWQRHPR